MLGKNICKITVECFFSLKNAIKGIKNIRAKDKSLRFRLEHSIIAQTGHSSPEQSWKCSWDEKARENIVSKKSRRAKNNLVLVIFVFN